MLLPRPPAGSPSPPVSLGSARPRSSIVRGSVLAAGARARADPVLREEIMRSGTSARQGPPRAGRPPCCARTDVDWPSAAIRVSTRQAAQSPPPSLAAWPPTPLRLQLKEQTPRRRELHINEGSAWTRQELQLSEVRDQLPGLRVEGDPSPACCTSQHRASTCAVEEPEAGVAAIPGRPP